MESIDKLSLINKANNTLCRLIGHSWRYKDYSNWMKENGEKYDFKATRKCSRCHLHEYLYEEWQVVEKPSSYDVERDSRALRKLPFLESHI
jgi:hypothetical protein